jgi:hypothetical protein
MSSSSSDNNNIEIENILKDENYIDEHDDKNENIIMEIFDYGAPIRNYINNEKLTYNVIKKLKPRKHKEYFDQVKKISDKIIKNRDGINYDKTDITKARKILSCRRRNLSEAMGSFLKLMKYSKYMKTRYYNLLLQIDEDRKKIQVGSSILEYLDNIN